MKRLARDLMSSHRPLIGFSLVMAVLAVVSAVGHVVDDRMLEGVSIWDKPLKFSLSFALYALTLAWLISRLQRPRVRRAAHVTGTVIGAASAGEMLLITGQVVRGRQSHFNIATPIDSAVFAIMGSLVVIIFVATMAVGVAFLLESPAADRATTWAVRLGLLISLAGMSIGFVMVAPRSYQDGGSTRGAHSVGVRDGGASLPLLGWDTTGGDLRISHFVGLHALQALPLLALALLAVPATARLGDHARTRLVLAGSLGYAGLFALTLWQALRGQALLDPDRWTVAALLTLIALTGMAAAVALRGDRSPVSSRRSERRKDEVT